MTVFFVFLTSTKQEIWANAHETYKSL